MKTGRKTIILIIVSQFSSFFTDHPSSLISREESSVFPPVSYTLLSFSVMFSDYRYAHISELLKSDFFMFWACLLLAPWLWLLIVLQFMSSFKIWCSFNSFFQNSAKERVLNSAFQVRYYTSIHLLSSGDLDHYLCLSLSDSFLCIFILFLPGLTLSLVTNVNRPRI